MAMHDLTEPRVGSIPRRADPWYQDTVTVRSAQVTSCTRASEHSRKSLPKNPHMR